MAVEPDPRMPGVPSTKGRWFEAVPRPRASPPWYNGLVAFYLLRVELMNRIIVDQTTVDALAHLHKPSELCDGTGRTLGYFTPLPDRAVAKAGGVDSTFTEAELDEMENEGGGRPLHEILAELAKRR